MINSWWQQYWRKRTHSAQHSAKNLVYEKTSSADSVFFSSDISHSGSSRTSIELAVTVLAALFFVVMYNRSPLTISVASIGLLVVIPILLYEKIEYLVYFLVAILPFRGMHIVSVIHSKRLIIWSVFIYIILRGVIGKQRHFSRPLRFFTVNAILFITMLVLSVFQTASELYTTTYLTQEALKSTIFSSALIVLEEILLLYIIYFSLTTVRQIRLLLYIIITVSACIAGLGICQYYLGGAPAALSALFDPDYNFYGRATSVFSNPNILGEFLGPLVGVAIVFFSLGKANRIVKCCIFLPVVIVGCWGIFLSSSRAAMLQVLFGMLVTGYLYYIKIRHKKFSWKLIPFIILIAGIFFSAIQYYEVFLHARLGTRTDSSYQIKLQLIETRNDSLRKHAALMAIRTAAQNPVFGIGYGMFSKKGIAGFEYFGLAAHNLYLTILVELGLLGFLPFLILLMLPIKIGVSIWPKSNFYAPPPVELQLLMLALVVALCTATLGYLFSDSIASMAVTGYFWIFAGAVFSLNSHWAERQAIAEPLS